MKKCQLGYETILEGLLHSSSLDKYSGKPTATRMTTAINGFRCTGICPVDSKIFPDHAFAAADVTNDDNQDSSDQGTTYGPSVCQRDATLLPFTSAATTFESSTRPAATTDSLTSMPATTTQSLTPVPYTQPSRNFSVTYQSACNQ